MHNNSRNRRDLSSVFNDHVNEFDNSVLTSLDSVFVNRNPSSDNELTNKKYINDELDKKTGLRFNQTLERYLKVTVENGTYNHTKYDKIQLTGLTIIEAPNSGSYLLPYWKIMKYL